MQQAVEHYKKIDMSDTNMELNHRKYLDRIDLYKRYGYDTIADRKFILEASMPLCGRILEVGTGKGHMALILARAGYDFVSVDISEEEQNIAKTNLEYYGVAGKVNLEIADAENLNYPEGSFDAIISVDTVHHMNNPFKVMEGTYQGIGFKWQNNFKRFY